jgi:hypothetical protein
MDARIPATLAEFEQETVETDTVLLTPWVRILAARRVRGFVLFPPEKGRAQETPGARCTRSLACNEKSTRVYSPQVRRTVRRFLRNGVTAYSVLSPANRAFLPPSPAKKFPRT